MILDNSLKLEAVLAGTVSASQPEFHVDYTTWNVQGITTKPSPVRGALNSNTDVTLLAAPTTQGEVREIGFASIYNKDTAAVTLTVKTDDGTNERIIAKATLATLEVLMYEKGVGWYAIAANGAIKNGSGVSGPASSTNNGIVRWDGATGTAIKDTSDITYDGTTYVIGSTKFTVASASGNTVVAGTLTVSAGSAGALSISVPALGKIFLDGGSNTFIQEGSADQINFYAGNTSAMTANSSGDVAITNKLTVGAPIILKAYTVSTLPAGSDGMIAFVTDALAPTFLGALTGGSTTHVPVFYDGSAWKSF